jgi:hypothetical protein
MPVILNPVAYGPWLDPVIRDTEVLNEIMLGNALTDLVYCPVAKQMNSVYRNEMTNLECVPT